MGTEMSFLIYMSDGDKLSMIAVKVDKLNLSQKEEEIFEYFMEPESRKYIKEKYIPQWLHTDGEIVDMIQINDVAIY